LARSVFLRRSLALAAAGTLTGLGLLTAAAPAQADTAPVAPNVSSSTVVIAAPEGYPGWVWCPYGYYWHHEGLLSGVLDGAGHLLGDLL